MWYNQNFLGLNLPLKNPTKTHENTSPKEKKKAKSIPNQQNPYHYEQIDIQKNNPNPSKFQNPRFGEITNQTINRNQNNP